VHRLNIALRNSAVYNKSVILEVFETGKQTLDPEHPDTLSSMANLALMYWKQRRWEKAEDLGVQVHETESV
jgi:hypothetical protein